jgi:hypothetical protein
VEESKRLEIAQEAAQSTPTKKRAPTAQRVSSLTPIPIPGIHTPQKVKPAQPWTLATPDRKAARQTSAQSVSARLRAGSVPPPKIQSVPPKINTFPPKTQAVPPKSILKTPERQKYAGEVNNGISGQTNSSKKKNKNKNKNKNRTPKISFTPDTKRGHGSSQGSY